MLAEQFKFCVIPTLQGKAACQVRRQGQQHRLKGLQIPEYLAHVAGAGQ